MAQFIIKDFQCLKRVSLNIEGLTLVRGDSSEGKTACLRAIYASTLNRFRTDQVRYGESHISVKYRWDKDSPVVSVLRKPEGSPLMEFKGVKYDKLGRSVPSPIDDYNNLGILKVGEDIFPLNFSLQFQKPLLLEFSQKKVMQLLSSSKGIDDWNKAHSELAICREQNRGAFKTVSSMLEVANVKISDTKRALSSVEPLAKLVEAAYTEYMRLINIRENYNLLLELLHDQARIDSELISQLLVKEEVSRLSELVSVKNNLLSLRDLLVRNYRNIERLENLNLLHSTISDYNSILTRKDLLTRCKSYLNQSSLWAKKITVLTSVRTLSESILDLISRRFDLNLLLEYVTNASPIEQSILKLESLIRNKECPLCGTKLDNHGKY